MVALPYREGMLPLSDQVSSGPNAHPRINPLGDFSKLSSNTSVLIHLEIRNVFQTVFFISQQEHYIVLEGIHVDWCHVLFHKEDT